jgi:hypothetical protein
MKIYGSEGGRYGRCVMNAKENGITDMDEEYEKDCRSGNPLAHTQFCLNCDTVFVEDPESGKMRAKQNNVLYPYDVVCPVCNCVLEDCHEY